jgi:uncharacterized protein
LLAVATSNPLLVSVRDLIGKPGEMREKHLTIAAPTHYGEAVAVVPEGRDLDIDLRLESVHEGIFVSGEVHTTANAECVRCLEPLSVPVDADFQELFAFSGGDGYDYLVVDETIDLDQVVRDQVVLQLPFQPVCSDDCAGLDPETGEKRPEGWEPPEINDIDPRWAELEKLVSNPHDDEADASK